MVIAVIAVLLSMVLGLGRRLRVQAQEKLTAGSLTILVAALEQYHDFTDAFPVAKRDIVGTYTYDEVAMESNLGGIITNVPDHDDFVRSETLYYYLNRVPNSRRLVDAISETLKTAEESPKSGVYRQFQPTDATAAPFNLVRFIDPWGNALRYEYEPTMTFPAIVSSGADGEFDNNDDVSSK